MTIAKINAWTMTLMFSQRALGLVSTFSDTQIYSFRAPFRAQHLFGSL
jgi:hypothetical protein